MDRLFGTSGIRGSAKELFTDQFCFDLGRTFSIFLDNHQQFGKIAVASDPRESSPRIKRAFIEGLLSQKRDVLDEGISPIPSMNWLLIKTNICASAMITGSHIAADLNGVKFFAFREEILKSHEAEIEAIYQRIKEKVPFIPSEVEVTKEEQARVLYEELLVSLMDLPYSLKKVVIDPGNGAQSQAMVDVFAKTGIEVVPINVDLTQNFLARDTESEKDFAGTKAKVKEVGADLGIAFDADGDRCVFIDEMGNFVPPEYACTLLAKQEVGDTVVTPISVSQVIETIGKKVIRTKVGSPYVVAKMKEVKAKFGFEANGGSMFSEYMMSRDGGVPVIKMLNLLKQSGKTMNQLVSELPKFYIFKDKVDCPWEKDAKVIEEAKKAFPGIKVEELDGTKIWVSETTWILFRSSQNAPEFRVFVESKDQQEAMNLGQKGIELVKTIISSK